MLALVLLLAATAAAQNCGSAFCPQPYDLAKIAKMQLAPSVPVVLNVSWTKRQMYAATSTFGREIAHCTCKATGCADERAVIVQPMLSYSSLDMLFTVYEVTVWSNYKPKYYQDRLASSPITEKNMFECITKALPLTSAIQVATLPAAKHVAVSCGGNKVDVSVEDYGNEMNTLCSVCVLGRGEQAYAPAAKAFESAFPCEVSQCLPGYVLQKGSCTWQDKAPQPNASPPPVKPFVYEEAPAGLTLDAACPRQSTDVSANVTGQYLNKGCVFTAGALTLPCSQSICANGCLRCKDGSIVGLSATCMVDATVKDVVQVTGKVKVTSGTHMLAGVPITALHACE